ncbi:hypothetical protein HDU81_001046 [Chytriomyces hyalinus]|nr:hypothetical protein HDU81_001046 [Chytriomyces hyalinus]
MMDVVARPRKEHKTIANEFVRAGETWHGKDMLLSLPNEVAQMILLYLPISWRIWDVARSSRVFSRIILSDASFVRKHIKTRVALNNNRKREYYWAVRLYNDLPLLYLTCILGDVFEQPIIGEPFATTGPKVKQSAGVKIASYLSTVLRGSALTELLDWMIWWKKPSIKAVLDVLNSHPDVVVSHSFMQDVLYKGWTEVMQLMVDRGYDVSQKESDLIFEAVGQHDSKMLVILLQDSRVDVTCDNYSLFKQSDSMEVAELLYSCIPNGPFFMAVSQGNLDAVTKYLALEELDPSTSNNLCLSLATHFNQIDVLKVLLRDSRILLDVDEQFSLMETAVSDLKWGVFHAFLAATKHDFDDDVSELLRRFCEASFLDNDWFTAFDAYVCHERVEPVMGPSEWNIPLAFACRVGSKRLVKYVLAQAGENVEVNAHDVVFAAIKRASKRTGVDDILDILASHDSFRPLFLEDTNMLITGLRTESSSLATYVQRKDQRFFSTTYLQRAFNDGFNSHFKQIVKTLAILPQIEISPEQQQLLKSGYRE